MMDEGNTATVAASDVVVATVDNNESLNNDASATAETTTTTTEQRKLDFSSKATTTTATTTSSTTEPSSKSNSTVSSSSSRAIELYENDQLLEAARFLKSETGQQETKDATELEKKQHEKILHLESKLEDLKQAFDAAGSNNDDSKSKQPWIHVGGGGGSNKKDHDHGTKGHDSILEPKISYRSSDDHSYLQIIVEQLIDPDMLIPILSVLNETQLYETWLPSFKGPPRFGIRRINKLAQVGRCSQIILATFDLPWPLSPREIVLRAIGVDDITSEQDILIHLQSLSSDDPDDGHIVPPYDDPAITSRLEFEGGFLFRKQEQTAKPSQEEKCEGEGSGTKDDSDEKKEKDDNDEMMVVQFYYNLHSGAFGKMPNWLIKFFVSQVFWRSWNMFINVAVDVKCGKRPAHANAIKDKRDVLYDWVDERIHQLMKM